jgi:hypothetical protein
VMRDASRITMNVLLLIIFLQ